MGTVADSASPDEQGASEESINPTRGHRLPWIWWFVHIIAFVPFRLFVRTRVIGAENLDPQRGGILLANHQSYLDPIFVCARLSRPVSFLARDTLWNKPIASWACRNLSAIPISRTAFRGGSIRQALLRLKEGFLVGIYPEGTRSSGEPEKFRPGFLALVRRSDVPIHPVAIVGADRAMPRGAFFIRPVGVTVIYGEAFSESEVTKLKEESDDKAMAELVREKVLALYREHEA